MQYPAKGAIIRFGRAIAAAALGAAIGVALNETPVVLEGTSLAIFVPFAAAILLAADKYVREKVAA